MFRKILLCSDGSERAIQAAGVAAQLARDQKSKLTLLHVCPMPTIQEPFPGAPTLALPALDRYAQDMHIAVMERTRPAICKNGIEPDHVQLEVGDPATVITRVAEANDYDLIVLGSRGLQTDRAAQLGSVSYSVIHRAHCPVLIVR